MEATATQKPVSLETFAQLRQWLQQRRQLGQTIGLVPTMGNLHEGHLSLFRQARRENDCAIGTIFVNPTQFGPNEDFAKYPRTLDQDRQHCAKVGVDALFLPTTAMMYPPGHQTRVLVTELEKPLCGAHRPGHFAGVATIVCKLFHLIPADRAYFGQKDFQQVRLIQQMVADLNMDIQIHISPIVREADGLAMSSRNAYLDAAARAQAPLLYQGLQAAVARFETGERNAAVLVQAVVDRLALGSLLQIEYVEVRTTTNLELLTTIAEPAVLAVAVRLGPTRLIDNVLLNP